MNPTARLRSDRLAIFLFHGVVQRCDYALRNYTRKHLLTDTFARVLLKLARAGTALSMDEVLAHLAEHEPFPPRAFAVTFDDGFANNLHVAAPILADLGVPATFYVTTSFVDANSMSWIDRLELCFERADPGRVCLPWRHQPIAFRSAKDRIGVLDEIRARVKTDASINRDSLVADVFEQCGVSPVHRSDAPLDQKLTWPQVRELADQALFTIGGHTHTHATLSFLSPSALRDEINTSLTLLNERAGVLPRHYSYPEGLERCYSPPVIETLKTCGVQCCPTAIDGDNDEHTDPFHLRRIMVAHVDGAADCAVAADAAPAGIGL